MRGNKVTERWPPIDRHPSENGQELTGLAEGTYPYRYKTDGWRMRSGWPRMHDSRSFHCAFTLRTGLYRKNSVKDRNRLADRKEEEATRMESRSFGQKVTVVRCMHRLTPRGNLGFYSQPFFPSLSPDEKKKKVIYKRSFVISILTAMILGFRLMHGHVHRFVSRCLSIGIFTSSRAMIILRITKYEMAKLPARVERNIDQ